MVKNVIKLSLSVFVLFSSISSQTFADKDDGFSSSIEDQNTGKTIMKTIKKAYPEFFIKNVESKKNSKEKLLYTITSCRTEQAISKDSYVTFSNTLMNKDARDIETRVCCIEKKQTISLDLVMSEDCLSKKGKKYFEALARAQSGIRE